MLFLLSVYGTIFLSGYVTSMEPPNQMPTEILLHSTYLDPNNDYFVAWDFDDANITFEVRVKTRGYIGLGFSPNGGMPGSDLVIGWVDDDTGEAMLTDRYAQFRSEPLVDTKQDYELLYGRQNNSHTVLRFRRPLKLCDGDDKSILEETIRLIWAFSDIDPTPDGAAFYHGRNRGTKSIYLLNPIRFTPTLPSNAFTFDLLNNAFEIPALKTYYSCRSFRVPEFQQKHHVIKFEPVIEPGHESFVHHIVLYGCYQNVANDSYELEHQCYSGGMPRDWFNCDGVMFEWAVGGGAFFFPENVGYPFGGHVGDPTMILMETHYDNPQLMTGVVDSSGLRFTLTTELRQHDAGIFQLGSFPSKSHVIPPYSDDFRTDGHCIPECLSEGMEDAKADKIHIFAGGLHTHLLGISVLLRHYRKGIELEPIMKDLNYDFNFQEMRTLEREVILKPGDHTVTECHYRTTDKTNLTLGGLDTTKEMCMAFMFYYPKIPVSVCSTSPLAQYAATLLGVTARNDGRIRSPQYLQGQDLYEVADRLVDWKNQTLRDTYQHLITRTTEPAFLAQCFDGGRTQSVNYRPTSIPPILWERPPIYDDNCVLTSGSSTVSCPSIVLTVVFFICMMLDTA